MNKEGSIVIIEDDIDDRDFLDEVFTDVIQKNNYKNNLVFLKDGQDALAYLSEITSKPFMVISDINMPRLDGIELRKSITRNEKLNSLCIPYIFLTTAGSNRNSVSTAYKLSVQGYFKKPSSLLEYKLLVTDLLGYWKKCITPY